jgi:hypothetical protein
MNTRGEYDDGSVFRLNQPRLSGTLALLLLLPGAAQAGGVLTNCTEAALRAAMGGGGTVTFACDGTIKLASTISNSVDTLLDGSGHRVTISGGGTMRIFCVNPNVTFTLVNLTLTQGFSDTTGAGILNRGGTVNALGVAFTANSSSPGTNGGGGAIRNDSGTLNLRACSFTGNSVIGAGTNTESGGAIYNDGTMNASACTFTNNQARNLGPNDTFYSGGGGGAGGAVYNAGVAVIEGSTFSGNAAFGAGGSLPVGEFYINGGTGSGGAICNLGWLTVQTSSFLANYAEGGKGGDGCSCDRYALVGPQGGDGGSGLGAALDNEGTASIASSAFVGNSARGGPGGTGGPGSDHAPGPAAGGSGGAGGWAVGAVHNRGSMDLVNCTFASNSAVGTAGGNGGAGSMYMVPGSSYSVGGSGGAGGPGGCASGCLYGAARVSNCTLAFSSGQGGSGGQGGPGGLGVAPGPGGAGGPGGSASGCLYGAARVSNCTLASSSGQGGSGAQGGPGGAGVTGPPGPAGAAGQDGTATGGFLNAGGQLVNTLLSSNTPANCADTLYNTDAGNNLSSDCSCAFTGSRSMTNTDPHLGLLANNGGPTLTMALLPGSPAIDAGNTSLAPATDQRGFPRPAGLAADIGAFEYASVMPTIAVSRSGATGLNILASGNTNQVCRLLSSVDLAAWVPIATNQIGSGGTVLFYQPYSPVGVCRFYRLVMP